jgi:hypothetical protein
MNHPNNYSLVSFSDEHDWFPVVMTKITHLVSGSYILRQSSIQLTTKVILLLGEPGKNAIIVHLLSDR